MPDIFCNRCGTPNSDTARYCANCGAPLGAITAAEPISAGAAYAPAAVSQVYAPAPARYGGFWIRFLAVIIDGIIVEIVAFPVSLMLGLAIGAAGGAVSMPARGTRLVTFIAGITFGILANWLYEALMESSSRQATLGKIALGMKVTDLAGNRISFARATGRHFAKILSGMILFIGYIMAGFTERKQAMHDLIAGTLVRKT